MAGPRFFFGVLNGSYSLRFKLKPVLTTSFTSKLITVVDNVGPAAWLTDKVESPFENSNLS